MKKIFTLFLALLMLTFVNVASASNERSAYTWCKELPVGAIFMFDYSTMSPVRTARPLGRIPTPNYILAGAHVAGFQKNELNPYAFGAEEVVPVNAVDNQTYVYPIVSTANNMVGLVWVTLEDGIATVSMRLREQVKSYHNEKFVLKVYSCIDEFVYDGMVYNLDEPFIVEENTFFFELYGVVSYPDVIGSTKIRNCCAYYRLSDYYRWDRTWKSYRMNLMNFVR